MDVATVYLSKIFLKRRSAICRGAILKGLIAAPIDDYIPNAPRILSTISRTSLGIPMMLDFQEGVHRKQNKIFDEVEGCYKVRDVMHWYIKKVCCATDYILVLVTTILMNLGRGKRLKQIVLSGRRCIGHRAWKITYHLPYISRFFSARVNTRLSTRLTL